MYICFECLFLNYVYSLSFLSFILQRWNLSTATIIFRDIQNILFIPNCETKLDWKDLLANWGPFALHTFWHPNILQTFPSLATERWRGWMIVNRWFRHPVNQLRLVYYPTIFWCVSYILERWLRSTEFWSIQSFSIGLRSRLVSCCASFVEISARWNWFVNAEFRGSLGLFFFHLFGFFAHAVDTQHTE